jgi:hypothetical protein
MTEPLILEGELDLYYGEIMVGEVDLAQALHTEFGVPEQRMRTGDGPADFPSATIPEGTKVRITVEKL